MSIGELDAEPGRGDNPPVVKEINLYEEKLWNVRLKKTRDSGKRERERANNCLLHRNRFKQRRSRFELSEID
jgi:hypothetical protein